MSQRLLNAGDIAMKERERYRNPSLIEFREREKYINTYRVKQCDSMEFQFHWLWNLTRGLVDTYPGLSK